MQTQCDKYCVHLNSETKVQASTIMKFFIVQTIAVTVFLLTNRMVPANGGQSLADLLRSLIQDEGSAQLMKTAIVESTDGRAQSFSLNIVGCDTISSTVRQIEQLSGGSLPR